MKLFEKKNQNYRKKYMYYFVMTFTIPTLIILLMNIISQNVVKNQILTSGKKTLTQFFGLLDKHMGDMIEEAYEIVADDEIISYARLNAQDPKKYSYYSVSLKKKLCTYMDAGYADILLWFAFDDRIISSKYSSQMIEPYYSYSYSEADQSYIYNNVVEMKDFYEVVKGGKKVPAFKRLGDEWWNQHLCLSLAQNNTNNNDHNFTVTIIVKQQWFDGLMSSQVLGADENLLVYNEVGELLFSEKEDTMVFLPEDYREQGVYEIEDQGNKYILLVQESSVIEGSYALKISKSVFWNSLKGLQMISWLGIVCSVITGILVASRFSNKAYQPLENALAQLGNTMKEKERLRKKLREDGGRKGKEFLLGVLEGRSIEDTKKELFEKNEIYFTSEHIFLGILSLENCGKAGWDLISFVIGNVFEELGNGCGKCHVLSLSGVRHVIVMNPEEGKSEEELEALLLTGVSFLKEHFEITATLGCGELTEEILGIHDAYQEAQQALEYQFLLENERVIPYRVIKERKFDYPFSVEHRMYQMMGSFLKKGDDSKEAVVNFVKRLLEEYGIGQEASMGTVECFKYDVLQVLNRTFMASQIPYFNRQAYLSELSEKKHLGEYCKVLSEIITELQRDFLNVNSRRNLSGRIRQYVEEHYMNSDLNVACIGEVFDMQAAYLSKIFREEYEITLPDYIARVRINKSKQLLKEGKLTIGEIAERTGFLSSNIYINNFKKWEAITPGKYRQLQENKGKISL